MTMRNEFCGHCLVGRYHEVRMPYICWIGEKEVVVPYTPGFVCDVCGDSVYESAYIQHLHRLIDRHIPPASRQASDPRSITAGGAESGQPIGRSVKS